MFFFPTKPEPSLCCHSSATCQTQNALMSARLSMLFLSPKVQIKQLFWRDPLPNELLNNSIRPSKHNSKPAEVCQQTQIMTSSRASFTGHLSQQRLRNGFFLFAHPTPYNTDANVCWMLWPRHCVCLHFPTRSFFRAIVYDTNKRDQRSPQCPVAFR